MMASKLLLTHLCFLGLLSVCLAVATPIVQTANGKVQGIVSKWYGTNTMVDQFMGIPFAQPPLGPLRFKQPEPPLDWSDVKNVSVHHTKCIQSANPGAGESEDCLYLDVFRPQGTTSSSRLPVMMFIHGGAYVKGSKGGGAGALTSKGVIVVRNNYRLGPLGFLSTEDDVIPGNYGALDQVSALKWVHSNIAAFGGNPDRVTIFGESAGSSSVSHLVLSPLTKGLFQNAIMESGAASSPWVSTPPMAAVTPKDMALKAGKGLGCGQTLGQGFLSCLQSKSLTDLLTECRKAGNFYRPRVETVFGFLPDYPLNLISRGEFNHVNTIRGFNAQESGQQIHDRDRNGLTAVEFRIIATNKLQQYPYIDKNAYLPRVIDTYIGNITDPLMIRSRAIDFVSDFNFISSIVIEAIDSKKMETGHRSYLYKFNQRAANAKAQDYQGVVHADEIKFVFGYMNQQSSDADKKVSKMMVDMWTNFAKYGNPTPANRFQPPIIHWDRLLNNKPSYLLIQENLEMLTYDTPYDVARLNLYRDTQKDYLKATVAGSTIVG